MPRNKLQYARIPDLLKLKRIELQGFKSFCDRTELRFNGNGIAAIVGPNGCGKSNVSDAISWVLGEQSAKSLRGTRMDDVIFAGTRSRKPVGMASVTMTLVDPTGRLEPDSPPVNGNGTGNGNGTSLAVRPSPKPGEVTITRRLYRSGESEYLIDGRAARLRDIQDIFMGTGLGPESYAIIEQGRIGQILSSRPQDRRSLIEEAAGITKFKMRRRLSEAKLEGARQNLTRVFDILEEVSRQVNSLKRQASKARRYGELKEQLAGQMRQALAGRFRRLERDAAKTALDLNVATAELQHLSKQVEASEQEHGNLQSQCYRTERELTDSRKKQTDLRLEAERTRGRLEHQASQVSSIEQRMTQGESQIQELETRLADMQAQLEAHQIAVKELEQQTESSRTRLAAKEEERATSQGRVHGHEQSIEGARQQVLRLLGESSELKNQLAQIDEYLAGVEREASRAQKEKETATADLERLNGAKETLSEKVAKSQLELQGIDAERRRVEAELADRRGLATVASSLREQLRGETSRINARKDSLEEILSHRAYTTESVKRLFTAIEHEQVQDFKPLGVLADFVEVDRAYEKATEEFLHDELEYVVMRDWKQAERGVDLMRTDVEGRATFLVHPDPDAADANRPSPEPAMGPETGIVAKLSDVLRLTNGLTDAPADLLPRLTRCFLAEDRRVAQRLAGEYPDIYFLLPDGVCYHGHAVSGGKKSASGPLALKRELRELTLSVQAKQAQLDETADRLATLEAEISGLETRLETLRGAQQNSEKQALALEHEMRNLGEELSRATSKLSVARTELERLRQESERSVAQKATNLKAVEAKEQARVEQEQTLQAARRELENLEAEAARIGEEHAALRVELAGLDERRRAQKTVQFNVEAQWNELARRNQETSSEMKRLGVERARLLTDNIDLDARATQLAQQTSLAESGVSQLTEQEESLRTRLLEMEAQLKTTRLQMQEAQEKRSQIELELVKRQSELRFLDETSRKELHAPIEELAVGDEAVLDEESLLEAEQRCEEAKARIEALGPVNPQALEEYQESQQRYDFLNAQRQDLLDSIRDTEKAIQEIDVESRKRFAQAFEAINIHFKELFQVLFGGGVGEMRLTDESNQAESGIDLVASPPGKRLQNVLLLSGGEKALTALALLMAVFRYQPSPFCVLDEVDAPLDESNIGRLTELLQNMSKHTQFVIITHAKKTMEVAQTLYGVTMQEQGVSSLVSVRLQEKATPALSTSLVRA